MTTITPIKEHLQDFPHNFKFTSRVNISSLKIKTMTRFDKS